MAEIEIEMDWTEWIQNLNAASVFAFYAKL